ncbi:MAG: hypothetical protein JXB07_11765 [Anaerolineae bacterium]|nr:hypothetical protein [Anaerolineae bacterium]
MTEQDIEAFKTVLSQHWPPSSSEKVRRYIGKFYECKRIGTKIVALVQGNHGVYTVSIQMTEQAITSACSCYIGKHGYCHHCAALAATFLNDPGSFTEIVPKRLEQVQDVPDLPDYLTHVTLDELIGQLRAKGITQKAFAESIGMSTRHLSAIKSSERGNRRFHELGAVKLACLWMMEHFDQVKK